MNNQKDMRQISTLGLMSSACAGMFVFGIVMAVLGAILPSLFERISFSKSQAGDLFLYMNLSMLVISLIFGPLVDRFGFKIFLMVCSLLVAGSFLLLIFSANYSAVLLAVVILGIGGGGLNGGTNTLTSDIHPEKRSSSLNVLGIFFGFGALTIPFLIGSLLNKIGLAGILKVTFLLCLTPFFLFIIFRFPSPKHGQGFQLRSAKNVIKHPLLWLCGFLLFFQSGNEFTLGGWISTYLGEYMGFTPVAASFILAGYWAAIMSGRLASSRIVRAVRNERVILASAVVSLAAAIMIIGSPSKGLATLGVVVIGLGFATIFPTTLAVVGELFPSFSGTAFSVVFAVALVGGMISPWLTGKIAHIYGLRNGLLIPVINCSMIIILQLIIMKTLRQKRRIPESH